MLRSTEEVAFRGIAALFIWATGPCLAFTMCFNLSLIENLIYLICIKIFSISTPYIPHYFQQCSVFNSMTFKMYLFVFTGRFQLVILLIVTSTIEPSPEKSNLINTAYTCLHPNITGKHTEKLLCIYKYCERISNLIKKQTYQRHRFHLKNHHRIQNMVYQRNRKLLGNQR